MIPQPDILEITDSQIICDYQGSEISVSKSAFEKWVDYDDKRSFELNYPDEGGDHRQETGLISWEDYYSGKYFPSDLTEFLAVRDAGGELKAMPDLKKSFLKIITKEEAA